MRTLVWLGLLLVMAAPAAAQGPAIVSGRITNAQGNPEAAVVVRIDSLNTGAVSTADGAYRLEVPAVCIRPGQSVTITASRIGLVPVSRAAVLSPDSLVTVDVTMEMQVVRLENIVVTGTPGSIDLSKRPCLTFRPPPCRRQA